MNIQEFLKKEIEPYPFITPEELALSAVLCDFCGIELFPGQEFFIASNHQGADKFLNNPLTEIYIAYFVVENEKKKFIELSNEFEKYKNLDHQVRLILPIECKDILAKKGIE
jgi:hypothetical protein